MSAVLALRDQPPGVATDYLASRGVTPEDIARYRIEFVTPAQAADRLGLGRENQHRDAAFAIWLPGWRADGTINADFGHAVFFRPTAYGVQEWVRSRPSPAKWKQQQDLVFMQPANGKPWREQSNGSPVVICESWLKALVVSKLGYLAVAMNGVYGWSVGGGQAVGNLCAGFRDLIWRDRQFKVAILTDSLNTRNPTSRRNVAQAKAWLASHLANQGVVARDAIWFAEMPPNPGGGDWGIDDLVMDPQHGPAAARKVIEQRVPPVLHEPLEIQLQDMNDNYCWVANLNKAFEMSTGERLGKDQLYNAKANQRYTYQDGNNRTKSGEVAKAWMIASDRNSADVMRFLPGQPQKLTTVDPHTGREVVGLNLWRGFVVDPWTAEADVAEGVARAEQYFADTVRGMFGKDDAAYLLKLIAHAVQHPEVIIAQFVYVYGNGGTGKNFLTTALRLIYGAIHFKQFTPDAYGAKFNASKLAAAWELINELPSTLPREIANALVAELKEDADPSITTRELEPKGVDRKTVDRNSKVFMASNFPPPFAVDDGLRRRMLLLRTADAMAKHSEEVPEGEQTHAWWAERWDWLTSEVGARDVLTYLLRLDTTGYKATDDARQTRHMSTLLGGQGMRTFPEFVLRMKRDLRQVLEDAGVADALAEKGVDVGDVRYINASMAVTLYQCFGSSPISVKTAGVDMTGQDLPMRKISLPAKGAAKARSVWFYDFQPGIEPPAPAEAFALIDRVLIALEGRSEKY